LQFRMDSIPPVSQSEISPQDLGNGWYHERPKVTIRTEPGAFIRYSLDNSTFKNYTRPVDIGEGVSYLTYFSADFAGNNETQTVRRFRVDTIAPLVLLNLSRVRILTGEEVSINVTASDDNGIQDYLFDFGDGTTSAWTRYGNYTRSFGAVGNFSIRVKVRDGSGLEALSEPMSLNVSAPPKKYVPPAPTIADYIADIPVYFYYMIFAVVAAALAGAGLRQAFRSQRRKKLYLEVEKAEAERERRHMREIDEETSSAYYGGGVHSLSPAGPGGFRGSLSAGQHQLDDGPRSFRGVAPGSFDGQPAHQAPAASSSDQAIAHGEGPEAPLHSTHAEEPAAPAGPDFGGAAVVAPAEQDVVYEAEIGSSKPIWAQSSKDKEAPAQESSRPARLPDHVLAKARSGTETKADDAGGTGDELDDIVNRLNGDNT